MWRLDTLLSPRRNWHGICFCWDRITISHTREASTEKRHLERFAEITEKLRTASDKEAYRILTKCEALIEKAKIDLVKKGLLTVSA